MAVVVRWAWRAAPRLTLLTGALQLVTGAVQAFGLLATANVFARLLAEGPTPERVVAALPALAVVLGAFAGRGVLDAVLGATQAALLPRVQRVAEDELYVALARLDLVAFDEPGLHPARRAGHAERPDPRPGRRPRTSDLTALACRWRPPSSPRACCTRARADGVARRRAAGLGPGPGRAAGRSTLAATASRARRLQVVSELIARGRTRPRCGRSRRRRCCSPSTAGSPTTCWPRRAGRATAEPRHDDRPHDRPGSAPRSATSCSGCCSTRGHAARAGGHGGAGDAIGDERDRQLDVPGELALRVRLHAGAPTAR